MMQIILNEYDRCQYIGQKVPGLDTKSVNLLSCPYLRTGSVPMSDSELVKLLGSDAKIRCPLVQAA